MATPAKNSSKYLPCLLTRLTDEHPFTATDSSYGTEFSLEQLKHDILVNLSMLLNSHTAPSTTQRLQRHFPNIAVSAYHFGIDSYAGISGTSHQPGIIAENVRQAIIHFEPRLDPESIRVQIIDNSNHDRTALHLSISSRLAVQPLSEDMYFRLRVDVETGESTLQPSSGHHG